MKFDANQKDFELIGKIVEAVCSRDHTFDRMTTCMDLTACHMNGNPLKLEEMLKHVESYDVMHDIVGIGNHINRRTGKLNDCFSPRFSV